ncbi:hypothetical protein BDZ97DRAFT_1669002 [Flammula alnicola]|nr:hypothetical protein BDZ97DRAFT_1669002 [Flammula alnicola]
MSSPSSSSSSSTSSSPIHHASLVDPATHNPALLELIDVKVSRQVIEYVVDRVVETVDYAMGRPTPSSSRGQSTTRRPEHAKFTTFVENVLSRAEVTMSTVLATLVYVDRATPHLHIGLEQWALERVFLGALIVASKYLNDSTLKNVHWALCTGVFGKRDVGRIEREFLDVLNFELKITEDDLLSHHQGLSEVVSHLTLSPRPAHAEMEKEKESEIREVVMQHAPSHHHTERRHTTRRRASAVSAMKVPELSPSSIESSPNSDSSSFYSPRTPSESSMDTSPEEASMKHHSAGKTHTQHHTMQQQQPHPTTARKMINAVTQSSTMDMLRMFPIPRMTTA